LRWSDKAANKGAGLVCNHISHGSGPRLVREEIFPNLPRYAALFVK